MAKFFEYNIPEKAPTYITPSVRPQFEWASRRVRLRMDSLEEALQLSGLRGEVFSAAVRPLFKSLDEFGDPLIDAMTVQEIADAAILLSAGCINAPERVEWPNCSVVVDTAFVSNHEWETLRMLGLGGSDSANVINEGFTSAQTVYYEKVGTFLSQQETDNGKQFIFDYGHHVEPLVIDEFCRRTGAKRVPETRMFCHKDYPFLTANIDQIVMMPDGNLSVFEAKTTTYWNKDHWAGGAVPRHYIHQCRKYPMVLNDPRIKRTYIGCIFGNTPADFCCSIVERDLNLEAEQRDREVAFWNDHVLAGVEPAPGGSVDATLELARMKAGNGNPATPPAALDEDQFTDLLASYIQMQEHIDLLKAQIKSTESTLTSIQAEIIEAIGSSETAFCPVAEEDAPKPGKAYEYCISYKARKSPATVDKEQLRMVWPDAYAACVKSKHGNRTFSVKVKPARTA